MNAVELALYARLTGNAPLVALLATATSVFNQIAPSTASLPYVVFAYNAGGPTNRSPRRAESLLYLVKAVAPNNFKQAGVIDDAIDTALTDLPLTVAGWTNYWLMRESRIRFPELLPDSKTVYHAGGLYRLRIAK